MSDQQMGKKEQERMDLGYFIAAYKWSTGEQLDELISDENPDFVCARPNGDEIGVELTRVMRDPEQAQFDRFYQVYEQEPQQTLDLLFDLLMKKEKTRARNYGKWANTTILVFQFFDCPLASLQVVLTDDLAKDFCGYGFIEIWLVDYTGIEAYGDVELFGLSPVKWWGYHRRRNPYRKPYG